MLNLANQCKSSQALLPKVHKSLARETALSENFVPESVYDNLVAAVNGAFASCNAMCNCVQKFRDSDLKMYDMYTPLSIQTTSIPTKNHWPKAKKSWLFG